MDEMVEVLVAVEEKLNIGDLAVKAAPQMRVVA
jgi:hypothetical protein